MTSTTQGRARRPYAPRMPPDERREQLLDAVLRVIVGQGIHKVSIDVVAREAGVTRPVLYTHFRDSDALLRASLDREEQGALAQLRTVLPGSGEPASDVVATIDRFLQAVLDSPDRWRAILMVADSSTPAFRTRLDRRRQEATKAIEHLLTTAGTGGDVPLLARMLLATVLEAGRIVLTEPADFPPERMHAFAAAAVARLQGQEVLD